MTTITFNKKELADILSCSKDIFKETKNPTLQQLSIMIKNNVAYVFSEVSGNAKFEYRKPVNCPDMDIVGLNYITLAKKLKNMDAKKPINLALGDVVTLSQGFVSFEIPTADPAWLVNHTPFLAIEANNGSMDSKELGVILDYVMPCIDLDKSYDGLYCININNRCIESLDGHKAAKYTLKKPFITSEDPILIALDKVKILRKLLKVYPSNYSIHLTDKNITFIGKNVRLHLKLSKFSYPDTNTFYSKIKDSVYVNVIDSVELLNNINLLGTSKDCYFGLTTKEGKPCVVSYNSVGPRQYEEGNIIPLSNVRQWELPEGYINIYSNLQVISILKNVKGNITLNMGNGGASGLNFIQVLNVLIEFILMSMVTS